MHPDEDNDKQKDRKEAEASEKKEQTLLHLPDPSKPDTTNFTIKSTDLEEKKKEDKKDEH